MDIRIFKPKVERILRASDLETVSAKRVRKQLMEDVGLDLKPYKVRRKSGRAGPQIASISRGGH